MKNGTSGVMSLSDENNTHYIIERPDHFTWRLRIRSIQFTDQGTYLCFVLTNQDGRVEDSRQISVVSMYASLLARLHAHSVGRRYCFALWRLSSSSVTLHGWPAGGLTAQVRR